MPVRHHESPTLSAWRSASHALAGKANEAGALFQEYLMQGGPDAIQSLRATVRKLQSQLEEGKADARLERFRRLQKDLQEADEVNAALRQLLADGHGCSDAYIDDVLQLRLFKTNLLYGASRELLLRENRVLRSQVDQRHVTTRTLRDGSGTPTRSPTGSPGGPSAAGGARPVSKSRANQARLMQGPHMEILSQLQQASDALMDAEAAHQLPLMRHAEVQQDDGSRKLVFQMEAQMAALVGQKLQLGQALEREEHRAHLLDQKLTQSQDDVVAARRLHADLLAHSDHISKDVREFLRSESSRADKAELAAVEARDAADSLTERVHVAQEQFHRATAALQALQATLQEKIGQVDTLRGLYVELRGTVEQVGHDVTRQQSENSHRLVEAMHQHGHHHHGAVREAADHSRGAHEAAHRAAALSETLAEQQRHLVTQVLAQREESDAALRALDVELVASRRALTVSERERRQHQRETTAALALSRLQDRRHDQTVKLLTVEVPQVVTRRLASELGTLPGIAEDVKLANEQISHVIDAGVCGGSRGARDQFDQWAHVNDTTSAMLQDSRLLRAQLQALSKDE